MGRFDFITDEGFRQSLESDYAELRTAVDGSMWKAAHVLAGSIVEAVLIDLLIAGGHTSRDGGLKMDLATAVSMAKNHGIIDSRAVDLSTVIRSYRNLIHPGRTIRLEETVDGNSTRVATALVEMIVDSVASSRQHRYGYTAEQIVSKLERDSTVDAIIPHLLREAKPAEIERLLLRVLPARLAALPTEFNSPDHLRNALQICFRVAMSLATPAVQAKVAGRFVEIVKEESDVVVANYGAVFFTAEQLEHLSEADQALVKEHIFSRLRRDHDGSTLAMLQGLGKHLTPEDAPALIDGLVRAALAREDPDAAKDVRSALLEIAVTTSAQFDDAARDRLTSLGARYKRSNHRDAMAIVDALLTAVDLPF